MDTAICLVHMRNQFATPALPILRQAIEKIMPFSVSWVMVDEVTEFCPPTMIRTRKLLSDTDPFIVGHFPNGPMILPGVLLIEFVGQSAYLLGVLSGCPTGAPTAPRLLARCSASFLSPAQAGDTLTAEVVLADTVNDIGMYEGSVSCGQRLVCRARVFGASHTPTGARAATDPHVWMST